MSFNEIMIVGNLGQDPDLRYTPQGTPVCRFTMATNDRVKQGGEWQKHTTWFRVTVFGRAAEACSQWLEKGREVFVLGRLRTELWVDRDGKNRFTNEVVADKVQFLGSRPERGDDRGKFAAEARNADETRTKEERGPDMNDDDVPF